MSSKRFRQLAMIALAFTFAVIVLGAYVRLSHAGLGCPDWPVCYGRLTWPRAEIDIQAANRLFPQRPINVHKARKEQVHRLLAGFLGLLVFGLAAAANWRSPGRRLIVAAILSCAIAGTIGYAMGWVVLAVGLSAAALGLSAWASIVWKDDARARLAIGLFGVVILQAMLGMWTVTWQLLPLVVVTHLLGGLTVLALLLCLVVVNGPLATPAAIPVSLHPYLILGLLVVTGQIFLGGWTSANYAAMACPDLPTCQGRWWPSTDFRQGFTLSRAIGVDYEGGVLDLPARTAIHLSHRIGALAVTLYLSGLSVLLWWARVRRYALLLMCLLLAQLGAGILTILGSLPLSVAVAHNAGAALLLTYMVWLVLVARRPRTAYQNVSVG